jgi:hypothetical protein
VKLVFGGEFILNLGIETETLEFKKSTGELKEAMNSNFILLKGY